MKKILYSFVFASLLIPARANSFELLNILANHPMAADPYSALVGSIASLIASFNEPELSAMVNIIQEAGDDAEAGDEEYEGTGEDGTATTTGFSHEAYDYVQENVFPSGHRSAWSDLDEAVDSVSSIADARQWVIDTFFIEDEEEMTLENEDKIKTRRTEYLQTIGSDYAVLAQEVQTRLKTDMESVKTTAFNGDGLVGTVSGIDQTWLAGTRALMADIALQLQLLELDAAQFMKEQQVTILEKPSTASGAGSTD